MGGQVVQRLLGPRVFGKVGDEPLGQPLVLGMLAQLAYRGEMEEAGLGAAARAIGPGLHRRARVVVTLEVVVGLGHPQSDQFLMSPAVTGRAGKRVARLRVSLRAKQAFGASEFLRVAR